MLAKKSAGYKSFKQGYSDIVSGRVEMSPDAFINTARDFTSGKDNPAYWPIIKPRLMTYFISPYSKGQMVGYAVNVLRDSLKDGTFGMYHEDYAALDFLKITGNLNSSKTVRHLIKNLADRLENPERGETRICGKTNQSRRLDIRLEELGSELI